MTTQQETPSSSTTTTRHVTLDLIRKRSEHNESLVSNLEEIALHQEELTSIGPVIGQTCGKTLRILLLQSNVISSMNFNDANDSLKYMKRLEYLNLALNNIRVVQCTGSGGNNDQTMVMDCCEFLEKLDLTLNFIDVDTLKESVDVLYQLQSLKELYLLGNPCMGVVTEKNDDDSSQIVANKIGAKKVNSGGGGDGKAVKGWSGCRPYIIARLPNLQILDGKQITRSERILANQKLSALIQELDVLAAKCRYEKQKKEETKKNENNNSTNGEEDEEYTEHTPESRIKLSDETYQQKMEKEQIERANQPRIRGEKEFEQEQRVATDKAREREERGDIRQCNEGKWVFQFNEEQKPGYVLLDISIQKHLSSSLIDVDIHPTYVSIVIKSKILRLILPAEVKAEESTAKRSTTTGHLLLCMPKVDPEENMIGIRASSKNRARLKKEEEDKLKRKKMSKCDEANRMKNEQNGVIGCGDRWKDRGLASEMLRDATERLGSVHIDGLVKPCHGGVIQEGKGNMRAGMQEVSTRRKETVIDNNDEPPPLF